MSKTIENLKSGNYEVVDNQGVSVTGHFVDLLNREMDSLVDDYAKRRIADLEAKLAESESEADRYKNWHDDVVERNKQLKQQLAEKEKEIEELKQRIKDTIKIYSDDFVEKDKELKELRFQARNIFPLVENLEEKANQDKISFCIEKLEKVKKELEFNSNNNEWITARDDRLLNGICDYIDNQIKQLKEGK